MFGLRVKDEEGRGIKVTPDVLTLFDGGREAMPVSGTDGQTYEKQIVITPGGESAYAEANIGVLADSFIMNIDLTVHNFNVDNDYFMQSWFLNNDFNFFTRNENTGVLSIFEPDKSAATAYDGLLSVFPIAFWDKRGGSHFSNINIFAGSCYLAYDQSASAYKTVYTVGEEGVENIDYAVFLRHYKGE